MSLLIQLGMYTVIGFLFGLGFWLAKKIVKA
jgi:high-affinity nickel permease